MEDITVSSCHCMSENYDFSSTTTKTMMGVLVLENSSARKGVKEENSVDYSSPCGTEKNDFSSTISTTTTTEVLVREDSADRKGGNEENAPDEDVTTLTTQISKQCARTADENSSPSPVMQQENNKAPATKTPTAMSVQLLKHQVPFRERNMEEGKRVLPPHIKVPPKKMFGYPERYRSPTDAMVSPVSRGLLTRNRRPARTLAPVVPPKALENTFQDVVVEAVAESGTH